jgi:predicted permease
LETLLTISLPFFGLIGAGYAAARFRLLPDAAAAGLNVFVFRFALPVMLFMKMADASLGRDFDVRFLLAYSGGGLVSFAACVVLGRLLFRPKLGESGIQGMAAAFGNVGYMGLTIIIAVFGERVIVPAVLVLVMDHLILLPRWSPR